MEVKKSQIQENLFAYLENRLIGQTLSAFLQKKLKISKSSAYKKISGEISLSLTELEYLIKECEVPVTEIIETPYAISFQSDGLRSMPQHPLQYLKNILKHLKFLRESKEVDFMYLSNDIPLFHLLQCPKILTLKLYIWDLTNWQTQIDSPAGFSIDLYNENTAEFEQIRTEMLDCYLEYSGIEVWSSRIFDSLIEQLKFVINSMMIRNKEDILVILDELDTLFEYLKSCAVDGVKKGINTRSEEVKEITIYENQIIDNVNLIYAKTPKMQIIYSMLDSPNFIYSTDQKICEKAGVWVDNVLAHSRIISKEGTQNREKFFRLLEKRLEKARKEITALLDYFF